MNEPETLAERLAGRILGRSQAAAPAAADYPTPDVTPGGPDDDGPAGPIEPVDQGEVPTDRRDWNPEDLGDGQTARVLSSADLANMAAARAEAEAAAVQAVRAILLAQPIPVVVVEASTWALLPVAVPAGSPAPVLGADSGRTGAMIRNTGTTSVYIGTTGAAAQGVNSWELEPGDVYRLGHNDPVHAATRGSDTGSLLVSIERHGERP